MSKTIKYLNLGCLALGLSMPGCSSETPSGAPGDTSAAVTRITCTTTADCVERGGFCDEQQGVCRASNECSSDADCAEGQCQLDDNFGGLCAGTDPGPTVPGPAWSCSSGADCPVGQGCADGVCKEDGECSSDADCGEDSLCYSANYEPGGICASNRPSTNPYCRSDGAGACRSECDSDGSCANGYSCTAGFCYDDDECLSDDDCSFNHDCVPNEDTGYSVCWAQEDPDCIDDGAGTCRYQCATDADCVVGGGCESDGFCHASNECLDNADCEPDLVCYEDDNFGGLCGPTGRE